MAQTGHSWFWRVICVAGVMVSLCSLVAGKTIYVDDDASVSGDGSSWSNAFKYLQDALTAARSTEIPVEVHVAQGTYYPDLSSVQPEGTKDRGACFRLSDGMSLLGGYAGLSGSDPNARGIQLYETVLSGDLLGNDIPVPDASMLENEPTRDDNGEVMRISCGEVCLEGCTIRGGGFGGLFIGRSAPSQDSIVRITDVTFEENRHFGPYNLMAGGADVLAGVDVVFTRCSFSKNAGYHGALSGYGRVITLDRCQFAGNYARGTGGGAANLTNARITNCVFVENKTKGRGGALRLSGISYTNYVAGCVFRRNQASWGGAILCDGHCDVRDCVFIANEAVIGGGAGQAWGGSGDTTVSNCIFAGNRAGQQGGAWCARYWKSLAIRSCTAAGNRATRGCFLAIDPGEFAGSVSLSNCILSNDGDEIWSNDWPVDVQYSCIAQGRGAVDDPNGQIVWGEGLVEADPCFADPGHWDSNGTLEDPNDDVFVEGDYHLKSQAGRWDPNAGIWVKDDVTSPCIDAGDPNSPVGDEPVPNGGRVNMGAHGGTAEASKSLSISIFSDKYGGGDGTAGDPYLIFTAEQFDAIGAEPADWDKHFRLMADVDLSGYPGHELHLLGIDETSPFSGVFDGDGHKISGLGRNSTKEYTSGALFGYLTGTVKGVGLIDPNVGGRLLYYTGTLVGDNHGTISDCYAHDVNVAGAGWYAGGLVGRNMGTIADCNSTGVAHDRSAGGLAGRNGGTITGSCSAAAVSADTIAGGLVGSNVSGTISNSCSTGTVTGDDRTGGLVGNNYEGTITCCYSAAVVVGNDGVGGLIGENWQGFVTNCYSAANVKGDRLTGGLVGDSGGGAITNCYAVGPTVGRWPVGGITHWRHDDDVVTGCFWDMETTGCSLSAAGTGKTTVEMQTAATFLAAGWDFVGETANGSSDVWRIVEGEDYPRLFWETGSE